jgi:sugar lactone lactonase YvrE
MLLSAKIFLFSACLAISIANVATAERPRSSIIIGESLANNKNPKPGKLNSPFGVDFDAAGNMYIVELSGGRVHKLDSTGNFTTIAGDGSKGYSGDNGPASKATFNGMHNVAVTPEGDVYISDSWNHCIRKIDGKSGIITTFAGTGQAGFSGDGSQATKATFNFLMCISFNATHDKIYAADLKNLRVRAIDLKTGIITTIAGNGKKGIPKDGALAIDSPLVDPRAVAVDSRGNVYILERSGHALRVVTPDGKIRTVAGTGKPGGVDGPALEAELNSPKHLAVDLDDNVIIADDQNKRIRKYDPQRGTLSSLLGSGVDVPKRGLLRPHGVCVHRDGSIFIVDTGHHRIVRLKLP